MENGRLTNTEKARLAKRKWREQNPERYKERNRKYYLAKRKTKMPLEPKLCLNCDMSFQPRRRDALYCGERCRQIAEWVRHARRKIAEGTFERPDIKKELQSRLSVLIDGFYDKRGERFVSEETREHLRRKGRCEKCGQDFTSDGESRFTVQHVRTQHGFDLQGWCYRCNLDQALSVPRELSDEESAFVDSSLQRARAPRPKRVCDDENNWEIKRRELVESQK